MLSGLVTERGLTPRRYGAGTADRRFSLAAAMRVIARVHDDAADGRADSHMTGFPCLSDADDLMFEISDLTDRRFARRENVSHLAAGHFQRCVFSFFRHELRSHARRSRDLPAFPGLQFDVVNHRTDGNIFQFQRVARP